MIKQRKWEIKTCRDRTPNNVLQNIENTTRIPEIRESRSRSIPKQRSASAMRSRSQLTLNVAPVHERLYNQMHKQKESRQKLEQQTMQTQLKEWTFVPRLNTESRAKLQVPRCENLSSRETSLYDRLQTNLRQRADTKRTKEQEEVAVVSSIPATTFNFFGRNMGNKENKIVNISPSPIAASLGDFSLISDENLLDNSFI